MARPMFARIITETMYAKPSFANPNQKPIRKTKPKINATIRLAIIPAEATTSVPHRLFVRLFSLYGTGFAQPKGKGEPERINIPGTTIEPIKSICLIGFNVNRFESSAVRSPSHNAAYPCATSWIITEKIKITIFAKVVTGSFMGNSIAGRTHSDKTTLLVQC